MKNKENLKREKEIKLLKIDDIIKKYQTNEMDALKLSKSENINAVD